jgi:hypothetical protein
MSVISRYRWRISIGMTFTLSALTLALVFTLFSGALTFAASLIQISSDPFTNTTSNHKTEVEPDTFAFGNTIVATFQQGRFFDGGGSDIGFATSTDGGANWVHGSLPGTTPFSTPTGIWQRTSDASVAFDAKHNVWIISFLGLFPNGNTNEVDVLASRSTDGGLTWGNPVVVNASGDFNDKNWTVCDDTASSPFYGNCYTEFDDFTNLNRFQMSTSKNGGKTWGAAKSNAAQTCVIGGQPVVQPDGTVVVPIDACTEDALLSIRSTDGGKTWTQPAFVSQVLNDGHPGGIRSPDLPSAEIDASGRVYVVWTDCRTENLCNSGNNDLLLSSSADGVNWTVPTRIPTSSVGCTAASCVDILIPGLAVDRSTFGKHAHLAVAYYTFPNINCTSSTCELNVGFLDSTNGGKSWSKAQQLAGPMTLTWLPLTTQGFMVADYLSTSIVNGANNATPVFEVAKEPTPPPSCSDLTTGAPGSGCDQATNTALVQIVGGTIAATSAPTNVSQINAKQRSLSRQTAF